MKARGLNQSDISRIAGVSRQAVSLWFSSKSDFQNIPVLHLIKLCGSLNISIDNLVKPVPLLSDPEARKRLFAEFCWDRAYPDIDAFFIALSKHQLPALARLAECRGMYESAHIVGNAAWRDYPKYSRYIHPVKRKECDHLWRLHAVRTSG
jgi:transcriptional regulator with XRE-family HTH domain